MNNVANGGTAGARQVGSGKVQKILLVLLISALALLAACGGGPAPVRTAVARSPLATIGPAQVQAKPALSPLVPTAIPVVTVSPQSATVGEDGINVREGPGTDYEIVGAAEQGESLTVLGSNEDNTWLNVETEGGYTGWVSADLVRLEKPAVGQPGATPTLSPGLRIARADIQSVYESQGFTFEPGPPVTGQPQVQGKLAAQGSPVVQLVGPADDLVSASFTILLGSDAENTQNLLYLKGFASLIAPGWEDASTWISDSVQEAIDSGEATTTYGSTKVTLNASKVLGALALTFAAK